jgi:hypothetical protein
MGGVYGVRVPVGDTRDGISDGTEKWDQERGDSGFHVVSETKAAALDGVVGQEVGEGGGVRREACGGFEEVCGCIV